LGIAPPARVPGYPCFFSYAAFGVAASVARFVAHNHLILTSQPIGLPKRFFAFSEFSPCMKWFARLSATCLAPGGPLHLSDDPDRERRPEPGSNSCVPRRLPVSGFGLLPARLPSVRAVFIFAGLASLVHLSPPLAPISIRCGMGFGSMPRLCC